MHILLTGGHTGIGLALSKRLIQEGHTLGLIIRSEKRKEETIHELGGADGLSFFYADLSKHEEVQAVAAQILQEWGHVDVLFNNAGVLLDQAYYSDRGNEMHFEVNSLAPYYLTRYLKSALEQAEKPLVINTATGGMHNQTELDIADLKRPKNFVKLFGSYFKSKVAMVLLMNDLASEWPDVQIRSVDPGPNKTNMTADTGMPGWLKVVRNLMFPGPEKGGAKLYQGAFDPAHQGHSGAYVSNGRIKEMKMTLTPAMKAEMLGEGQAV